MPFPRSQSLDLLRAIAIIWVMLFHAQVLGLGSPCEAVARWGWMGVDLFFVLSGYLIGRQVLQSYRVTGRFSIGDFYLRRALRIFPAYLAVVALYFGFASIREANRIQPLWQFLTFTENLLIDYSSDKAFSHVWSLCVEEHFYLLFPVAALALLYRPSVGKTVAVLSLLVIGGALLRFWIWEQKFSSAFDMTSWATRPGYRYFEQIYYPTYTRLDGLLVGVLLGVIQVFRPIWWSRATTRPAAAGFLSLALAGITAALFRDRFGLMATVFGFPVLSAALGAVVILAATRPVRVPWFGSWFTFVALISYSLYLSHKLAFTVTSQLMTDFRINSGWGRFVGLAGASLVTAFLLYLCVETPFLRLRERLVRLPNSRRAASLQPKPDVG